ncbi:MAG: ATP-dependent Clp protease proteolytic subunit [Tenericutes bacterium]|nr:ATP-dependent Clp protease proteolytic subunit [Mycoplasmatota bacterium]
MNFVPMIVERELGSEKSYDIFSRLLKDRIVFITGEIDDTLANNVIAELLYLDSINNNDINIYINSPGGSVSAGMAIYDTINFLSSDVSTTCLGIAASMAAFLLAAGKKGKRFILPNADVMIHQPLGGAQGQATEIKIASDRIVNLRKRLNKCLSKNTGQSLKKIEKDTERDNYLDAKEAVLYGLVDKIILEKEKRKA